MTTKIMHSNIYGFIAYKMTKGECKPIYQEKSYLEKRYKSKILGVQTPTV